MIELHSCAALGEPMTMIRSPRSMVLSPRGTIAAPPRMMLATLESAGIRAELDDLHLAVCEDVRLPGGRHAQDLRDGVGRLQLRRDDEVDVEVALLPRLEVLDLRRPDDRPDLGAQLLRQHRRNQVRLVP